MSVTEPVGRTGTPSEGREGTPLSMPPRSDVVIVGGGVIGCACAYFLTRRGASVTLIEKGKVGHGCSYGNAGWIVPSHSLPLPMPGMLRQAAKWLLRPDSPLYIKPRLDADLARWLWRFLTCSTHRHVKYAAPVLAGLARHSLALFKALVEKHGAEAIRFRQAGLLFACNTRTGLAKAREELEVVGELGVPGRMLDADALREKEPALTGPLTGGVWYESEAHAEPLKTVEKLAELAVDQGATIIPATEVREIETAGAQITALRTTRGRIGAAQFVLAAGSWTPRLARLLKLRVPIEAGKGYALIVEPVSPKLTVPTALVEKKVGLTPRDGSMRLAGTMELAGLDESITQRRVDAIVRGAREFVSLPREPRILETWCGMRPCTPDGIPMIGRPRGWNNLTIAAGHAMLGLTLSLATGQLVADLCTGNTPAVDPTPFRPTRF